MHDRFELTTAVGEQILPVETFHQSGSFQLA
jgi:hypothetical protein